MVKYYKNKMDSAYALWQEAVDSGEDNLAKPLMDDYLNYKQLYDGILSKS